MWSRNGSSYFEIFSENNLRKIVVISITIGRYRCIRVCCRKNEDVNILADMIEIKDRFKECCISPK